MSPNKRPPIAEVYRGNNRRWYWRLKSGNGLIIATSAGGKANGYSNKYNAQRAFEIVALAFASLGAEPVQSSLPPPVPTQGHSA